MKNIIAIAGLAAIAGTAVAQDSDIAYWAFNNQALPGGGFGWEVADLPQGADFGLQAGTAELTAFGGLLDNDGSTYDWIKSFSGGGSTNLQFGEGTGGTFAPQAGTDSANNGSFFELSFDGTNYEDILLTFNARATGSGFQDIDIDAYDGSTFLGSIAADQSWTSSLAPLQSYSTSLLDGVTDARIRFTLNGATSTSGTGNNRYDNFFIQGDLIPAPGAAALLGLAGFVGARRRRV